jgi:hypothetical protein
MMLENVKLRLSKRFNCFKYQISLIHENTHGTEKKSVSLRSPVATKSTTFSPQGTSAFLQSHK